VSLFDPERDTKPEGAYLALLVSMRVVNTLMLWLIAAGVFLGFAAGIF
jgi:hypothetical protein